MPNFFVIFNCSNRVNREKNKSNYCFFSNVKNSGKEGLKLLKVRREKWIAQIVRKDLTKRKVERTGMKITLHWFFHKKFTISNLKKSINVFYPN